MSMLYTNHSEKSIISNTDFSNVEHGFLESQKQLSRNLASRNLASRNGNLEFNLKKPDRNPHGCVCGSVCVGCVCRVCVGVEVGLRGGGWLGACYRVTQSKVSRSNSR